MRSKRSFLSLLTARLYDLDSKFPVPTSQSSLQNAACIAILIRFHSFFQRIDRILRRSLGVSETAPTDTTVRPAPPVAQEVLEEDDELEFDDSHMQLDPEALGLKVGKPVLKEGEEDPFKVDWKEFKRENLKAAVEDQESESAQKPVGHDEL